MRPTFFALCAALFAAIGISQENSQSKEVVTYKDHVAPILRKHCGNCHNADEAKSDLNLLTYQTLISGGSSGEAIAPGSSAQSLLYRLISHQDEPSMPPNRPKLPEAELALIAKWIDRGAPETAVSAAKMSTRQTDIDLNSVASVRPQGEAALPTSLPKVELPKTRRGAAVTALATSPWAPVMAVSGHERILLYSTDDLKPFGAIPFPEGVVHVLKFSRNGEVLLAGGGRGADSGKVVLFDVKTGKRLAEIGDESDSVLAADLSPDQKLVALGGTDKLIKVFAVESGKLVYQIKKHTDWVTAIEFSPDGNSLASGDRNGGAFVWEASTGGIIFTLGDHKEMITELSWRADSQMLATASEDGRVIMWYGEDGFPSRTVIAHPSEDKNARNKTPGVLSVNFARDGTFATSGRDKSVKVWNNSGSQSIAKLEGFTDLPSRVIMSHDNRRIIAGDLTGMIRVWEVKDKSLVGEFSTN